MSQRLRPLPQSKTVGHQLWSTTGRKLQVLLCTRRLLTVQDEPVPRRGRCPCGILGQSSDDDATLDQW